MGASNRFRRCLIGLVVMVAMSAAAVEPTITVVTSVQPPYSANDDGMPSGMFIDIFNEIGKHAGLAFRFDFAPWKRAQLIAKQSADLLIAPLARSPEREPLYQWIVPVLQFDTVLFTINKPPQSLAESRLLSIGLMYGTTFEKEVEAAGLTKLQFVQDELTNARKLHAGRIDGWVTTDLMAPGTYRRAGFDPASLQRGPKLGPTKVLYIAASLTFPAATAKQIADALMQLKKDGVLDMIVNRYR